MKHLPALLGALMSTFTLVSCTKPETTSIGKTYPDRGLNCEVTVVPDSPPGQVENIATSAARCHAWKGRGVCIEKLKAEACRVGADLVYGFREGRADKEYHVITATLARGAADVTAPAQASGGEQTEGTCSPPCSPGYACQAGSCQALCNPPCSPGYVCGADRTCQAEAPAPTASAP